MYDNFEVLTDGLKDWTGISRRVRVIRTLVIPDPFYPLSVPRNYKIPRGFVFDANSGGGKVLNEKDLIISALHDWLYQNRTSYPELTRKRVDAIAMELARDYGLYEKWSILKKWWAQPILWTAWRLKIGGFHNILG